METTVKLNEREARYIQVLASVGLSKKDISRLFNYKYMDVVNVLRGNSYNQVTGILQVNESAAKIIEVTTLLQKGIAYRKVSEITGMECNKVRNILGYLKYAELV